MNWKLKLILFSLSIIFVTAIRAQIGFAIQSPPEITKFVEDDILIHGDPDYPTPSIILYCEARGYPAPDYFWIKNGGSHELNYEDERIQKISGLGTLVIDHPQDSDVGQYQCVAMNKWGVAVSNTIFIRRTSLSPFKDTLMILNRVTEGQPYSLSCQIPDGYPKPHFGWVKLNADGSLSILNDSRITPDPEGTLWFSNLTRNDSSGDTVYTCAALSYTQNQVYFGNKFELDVIPKNSCFEQNSVAPVKQYTSPEIKIATSGYTIHLYCIFGGTPLPTVTWYKNDELIQFNGKMSLKHYGKSLQIKYITSANEGNYTCQANNGVGDPISHTTTLKILAKPTFTKRPKNAIKLENETVEFHCEAAGNPTPEIKWTHNGKPLSEAPFNPRRVVSSNSIVIEKLQRRDTGNYGCNASNTVGYVYQDVFVNVLSMIRA